MARKVDILAPCENAAPRAGAGGIADFQDDSLEPDPVMRHWGAIGSESAEGAHRTLPNLLAPRFRLYLSARLRRARRAGSDAGLLRYVA